MLKLFRILFFIATCFSIDSSQVFGCTPEIKDSAGMLQESSILPLSQVLRQIENMGLRIQVETYPKPDIELESWPKSQWLKAQEGCLRISILKKPNGLYIAAPEKLLKVKALTPYDIREATQLLISAMGRGGKPGMDQGIFETLKFLAETYSANQKEILSLRSAKPEANFLALYPSLLAALVGALIASCLYFLAKAAFVKTVL